MSVESRWPIPRRLARPLRIGCSTAELKSRRVIGIAERCALRIQWSCFRPLIASSQTLLQAFVQILIDGPPWRVQLSFPLLLCLLLLDPLLDFRLILLIAIPSRLGVRHDSTAHMQGCALLSLSGS